MLRWSSHRLHRCSTGAPPSARCCVAMMGRALGHGVSRCVSLLQWKTKLTSLGVPNRLPARSHACMSKLLAKSPRHWSNTRLLLLQVLMRLLLASNTDSSTGDRQPCPRRLST